MLVRTNKFKFIEVVFNISIHGAGNFAFDLVPLEVDADILFTIKVDFGCVSFMDGANDVVNFLLFGVFDLKTVNYEFERDFMVFVKEEANSLVGFDAAKCFKMLDEIVMGNFASFFEVVQCTFDFGIDKIC